MVNDGRDIIIARGRLISCKSDQARMGTSKGAKKATRRTKVARLIDEYDLEGLGDELERLWTATGNERRSLRELADVVNKEIIRSEVERADVGTFNNSVEEIYRRLTGETGTTADQTRTRRQLEREGVDVEAVESDFVSYQAVRSFLKKNRGAEYSTDENPIERDRESIQQLRNRTAVVTKTKLQGLEKADEIELGSHEVTVTIDVFCEDCGRQFDVTEVLDRNGCDCKDK